MDNTTTVALSRLVAQQRAMDVTAGNLANASTPGFKAERMVFSDWLSQMRNTTVPTSAREIAYTQDRATYRDFQAGAISTTGNTLDVALSSEGWLTVQTAAGPRLTRAGRMGLMPDGTLADAAGDRVLDTTGRPITLAASDTDVSIAGDGTISGKNGRIGKLGVVTPADPMQMVPEGGNNFRSGSQTRPVTQPKITQGAVEGSNVQPVTELTQMMTTLREFQFVSQMVQSEGDRTQSAIDKILPASK